MTSGSLSPSRAGDFKACPLRYRFRTIDRLPEETSPAAARGTVVHKVLEELFDLPAADRTPARAATMVEGAWATVLEAEPDLAALFGPEPDADAVAHWLESCRQVLGRYFDLEDPRRLEPAERELLVEAAVPHRGDEQLLLRGVIDRVDVAPDGAVRVVDYKTGRSVGVGFEGTALFQLRFYALVLWRTRAVVPRVLTLLYLGDGQTISYSPDEADLLATERQLRALWDAIDLATRTGDWRPNPGRLCDWCSFRPLCPSYGGTPPDLPAALPTAGQEEAASAADESSGRSGSPG
ncbi:MAG TPA: PD-(D/E)XK nuclease family protein [Marmoricola sp.]|jgi:putative RecB family exonuclease|nr:PD-(D/E)XK nuclease family protein [Marmoricola sp.]